MSIAMTASYVAAILMVPIMSCLAGAAFMTGLHRNWGPHGIREPWKKAFHVGAAASVAAYIATFPTTLAVIPDAWQYEQWLVPQGILGSLLSPVASLYWETLGMSSKVARIFTKGRPE